jgi:hypothetical protein
MVQGMAGWAYTLHSASLINASFKKSCKLTFNLFFRGVASQKPSWQVTWPVANPVRALPAWHSRIAEMGGLLLIFNVHVHVNTGANLDLPLTG